MKRPNSRVVFGAALLAAAMAGGRSMTSQAQEAPAYEIRYLLGLGGTHSRGNSINNDGWVAGYSHLDLSYRHAALWWMRHRSTSAFSEARTRRRTATSRGPSRTPVA